MAYTDIDKPTDYFDTTLYTGNGSSQTLTMDNVGLLWMKRRDSTIRHCLFDSVRGGHYTGSGNAPLLVSDSSAAAQGTDIDSAAKGITFGATQTVIGNDAAGYSYNVSGHSMVGWQWQAGGSASSNTDGDLTVTSLSVNQTAGFSIGKITNGFTSTGSNSETVGHGLNAIPKMIILKNIESTSDWFVYHHKLPTGSVGQGSYLNLNQTYSYSDGSIWNNTAPTSSVWSVRGGDFGTGEDVVFYAFAEKKGFSKFGSYTGNGNADGTFVYTGLSPSFVLLKETSNANNWMIFDNKRSPFNLMDDFISPDISDAESTGNANNRMDMLSSGFKIRGTGSATNRSGSNFIYMAFAESPFVTSTGIPTTAR